MTTTTIPNDQYRDMNHNNVVEGTSALNERTERWDVMEDVLPEQQDQGPMDPTVDTMTHEVESLLQFMDQYKTFSPLLNHRNAKNTTGHRHHHSKYPTTDEYGHPSSKENRNDENKACQDHENINNDDDSHYVPADKVTTSMKSRNDLYDPNQLESSFVHHSMVVSNSSSSSASSSSSPIHARQGMDDAQEHNATTGTSTHNMNNIDPSPPLGPVKLPTIPDQENHSPPHVPLPPSSNHWNMDMEREKLRAWVIQVRQAVYEWVQEYREYMMTVQQQQQHLPHPQHQMRPLLMSRDDRKASLPQHPPQDDSDPQIILQRYEQTIVSLNDIIQEQRQRIQDLEMSLGNEGNDSCSNDQQHRNETSRANHSVTASAVPPRPPSALLVTVVSHDADDHPTTIRHDARRTKPENVGTETQTKQEGTTTRTLPIKTTSAMILKTKNCKRIAYSNGTVHEIYYDDDDDDGDIETDRRRSDATTHVVPMPKHHQQQQRRKRLYDIIRYHNGDIKMTTTTAASRQPNDDNKETLEETYYYYSKSGIIRIARHSRSHHPCDGTTTTENHGRTPAAVHQSSMEYHYPNGQIEYYIGKERVIQLPNGKILNQHDV